LPGLENLFVLTFCALMLIFFRPPPLELRPLLSFLIVFSVLLFVIVGLTTANFGAMIRYRSVALPFFTLFVLTITDWNRIARLLKRNGDQGRR
jgi:NADH:ubiquinone oxidoreductase subunit 2 (subunit N)